MGDYDDVARFDYGELTPVPESCVDEIFREMMAPLSQQPSTAVIQAAYGIAKYRARREVR